MQHPRRSLEVGLALCSAGETDFLRGSQRIRERWKSSVRTGASEDEQAESPVLPPLAFDLEGDPHCAHRVR